jgi:hypothetical protein
MPDESLRSTSGSTLTRPPTLSPTTGGHPRETRQSGTGTPPSERGVDAPATSLALVLRLPPDAARSLTSLASSRVEAVTTTRIANDGQFEIGPVQVRSHRLDRETALTDLAVLDKMLQSAPHSAVVKHVAVLRARTKSASPDPSEARFVAEVLVEDLARYPIDVVEHACRYWVEGGRDAKWFPSWPELFEICERRMQPRRALRKALQWVADGQPS